MQEPHALAAEKGRKNAWRILPAQVKEVMILILPAAGAVAIIFITEFKKLFLRKKQDFITA